MSVIDQAIAYIKRGIPRQVLEVAFLGDIGRANRHGQSIDWYIRNKVIDNWVRPDCDLLGSYEDNIPLATAEVSYDDKYRFTARIPKEATGGRSIVAVLALNYIYNVPGGMVNNGWQGNSFNMSASGNSPLMNVASRILRSASPAPITGSASVQLVAENVVLITDYIGDVRQCSITCRLSHDMEMNNISNGAVPHFRKLCMLACKAWIYAETTVDMDQGYLYNGMEITRIKEIIDGFSDSLELYDTYFDEQWSGVSFMDDANRSGNWYRTMIAGKS